MQTVDVCVYVFIKNYMPILCKNNIYKEASWGNMEVNGRMVPVNDYREAKEWVSDAILFQVYHMKI